MATKLSRTTKEVKQLLFVFLGFIVLVLIISWVTGAIKNPLTVPGNSTVSGYPKADQALGQIPVPKLQSLAIDPTSKAIIANNSKPFPTLPPVGYIYAIKPEREYLGDSDTVRAAATKLNFSSEETKVINNIMYWETPEKNRVLSYDNAQRLWDFHYNSYPVNSVSGKLLTNKADYQQLTRSMMSQLGIKNDSFDQKFGHADPVLVSKDGQITTLTTQPNAVKVSLYKKVSLSKPLSQSTPETFAEVRRYQATAGVVEALISGDGKELTTNLWQFHYKQYSYDSEVGLYLMLTPLEAYTKLQTRQGGYLYQLKLDNSNIYSDPVSLNINEYTLADEQTTIIYIEPENRLVDQAWTNYLQPYYYFTGTFVTKNDQKGTCAFIVPALIDSAYRSNSNP